MIAQVEILYASGISKIIHILVRDNETNFNDNAESLTMAINDNPSMSMAYIDPINGERCCINFTGYIHISVSQHR